MLVLPDDSIVDIRTATRNPLDFGREQLRLIAWRLLSRRVVFVPHRLKLCIAVDQLDVTALIRHYHRFVEFRLFFACLWNSHAFRGMIHEDLHLVQVATFPFQRLKRIRIVETFILYVSRLIFLNLDQWSCFDSGCNNLAFLKFGRCFRFKTEDGWQTWCWTSQGFFMTPASQIVFFFYFI